MTRPKKINLLTKQQIDTLVDALTKYGHITINNFLILEMRDWTKPRTYFNLVNGQQETAPRQRLSIRKAKYLKDEIKKRI